MGETLKLVSFLARQPFLIRLTGAIVLTLSVGVPVGLKIRETLQAVAPVSAGTTSPIPSVGNQVQVVIDGGGYAGGQPIDPPKGTKSTVDNEPQALAQMSAARWHNTHSGRDDPPWIYIEDGDRSENFVKYKFYKRSDGCVNVVRSQQGIPTDQWIMNPLPPHKLHVDSVSTRNSVAQTSAEDFSLRQRSHAHAMSGLGSQLGIQDFLAPFRVRIGILVAKSINALAAPVAAAGQCLNPHPGTFEWWWGPPVDACWSPMYRRFPDGCVHLQMYNRCANAWDQRIQWQVCVH
jgi:hypothetical protein